MKKLGMSMIARVLAPVALVGLPASVLAHEGHEAAPKVEKHVTIIKRGEGGKPVDDAHIHAMHAKCDAEGQKIGTDVETGRDGRKQRTRIMICGKAEPMRSPRSKRRAASSPRRKG